MDIAKSSIAMIGARVMMMAIVHSIMAMEHKTGFIDHDYGIHSIAATERGIITMLKTKIERLEKAQRAQKKAAQRRDYVVQRGNGRMKITGPDINFLGPIEEGEKLLDSLNTSGGVVIMFNIPPK